MDELTERAAEEYIVAHSETEQHYTMFQAAAALGVSYRTVKRYVHDGWLAPFIRMGKAVRIPASTIEKYQAKQKRGLHL